MSRSVTTEARKKHTREMIELGALIVKAGMRSEPLALLLGLLIDARRRLRDDEAERSRLMRIGTEAFANDSK
jgi:hypothetical protein